MQKYEFTFIYTHVVIEDYSSFCAIERRILNDRVDILSSKCIIKV